MRKETALSIFLSLFIATIVNVQCKKQNDQMVQPPAMPGPVKGMVSNEYNKLLPGAFLNIQ